MSAEPKYTERDKVLFLREGYEARMRDTNDVESVQWMRTSSARRFPLPSRTVPRVVKDPHAAIMEWSIGDNGRLQYRHTCVAWKQDTAGIYITADRVRVFTDLFAHPTEEVADDA